jgi:hypothetical protein
MKRHLSFVGLPALFLIPDVAVAVSIAPLDAGRPSLGARSDWRPDLPHGAASMSFVVPVDPVEFPPRRRVPPATDQPVIRERNAVLPDPLNGWVLLDRALAAAGPGRPIPVRAAPAPRLHRIHQHWWLGSNFVLPVARGG